VIKMTLLILTTHLKYKNGKITITLRNLTKKLRRENLTTLKTLITAIFTKNHCIQNFKKIKRTLTCWIYLEIYLKQKDRRIKLNYDRMQVKL